MTPRLPHVLSERDLPSPELAAARLDGEVFAVGDSFCAVDEIVEPWHRARSLALGVHERLIAEQLSAAWVWGVIADLPAHHQFCVSLGSRVSRSNLPWRSVREVVVDDSEVVMVGALGVTTPLRTIADILRASPRFGELERRAVAGLVSLAALEPADCAAYLDARRNLPGKRRALERLALTVASPS